MGWLAACKHAVKMIDLLSIINEYTRVLAPQDEARKYEERLTFFLLNCFHSLIFYSYIFLLERVKPVL